MQFNTRDLLSGGIVCAIGLFFALTAVRTLPIGTPLRMGPGFFPVAVGLIVTLIGLAIAAGAWKTPPAEATDSIRLRPILMISASILAFLATVRGAGLMPAVFLVVVLARAADPQSRLAGTLVLALTMCALCAAVFVRGLGLPLLLFGAWWPEF